MNIYFAVAGALAIILGLVHSVLGELLLISRLNKDSLPKLAPFTLVALPQWGLTGNTDMALRTLRFSWHLPTLMGAGFGAILLRLSWPTSPDVLMGFIQAAAAFSFFTSGLMVLFISRGKHPGWVFFLAIAVLIWLGQSS